MRTFIAIPVPKEIQQLLRALQKQLPEARMSLPKEFHLTLTFLGDIDEQKVAQIKKTLKDVPFQPFELCLDDLCVFTPHYLRVIWVGVSPTTNIDALKQHIDKTIERTDKDYTPHLTIARIKSVTNKQAYLEALGKIRVKPHCFRVDHFELIQSLPTQEGATYRTLSTFLATEDA